MKRVGDFVLVKEIGRGSFSTVYLGKHVENGVNVAVKVIKKGENNEELSEWELLKQISHPFISQFYEKIEDEENTYLVMEYLEEGNLLNYVNNNGCLDEAVAQKFFFQMISAIDYLHNEAKIVHRDIKCENVLIDKHGNIRLIDFGLSKSCYPTCLFKTACGSPAYLSPEVISGNHYTSSTDIWAIGVVLYAIMTGHLPFEDNNENKLLNKIQVNQVIYPSSIPMIAVDLLSKMFKKNPNERIDIKSIIEHPWFQKESYLKVGEIAFANQTKDNPSFIEIFQNREKLMRDINEYFRGGMLRKPFQRRPSVPVIVPFIKNRINKMQKANNDHLLETKLEKDSLVLFSRMRRYTKPSVYVKAMG